LLKGCERWFIPGHPRAHYCGPQCREAARRWQRVKASRAYRASDKGRQQRREENRRYRERRAEREAAAQEAAAEKGASEKAREGKRMAVPSENFAERMCDRPGCYVLFWVKHDQSSQRFCSMMCRLALRRVLDREARYQQRRRRWRKRRLTARVSRPDTS
jgi:hypothetical protein